MSSLYVDRRGIELRVDGDALAFYENNTRCGTVPVAPLSRVFLRGDVSLHANVLGKLGEHGVGVVVMSGRKGEATLLMHRPHNDARRRLAQFRLANDPAFRLTFAECTVRAKIAGQRDWLAERRETDLRVRYPLTVACRALENSLASLSACNRVASLRGVEGAATAAYFSALHEVFPPALGFHSRNRRPPQDPVNAVLSLGYTLLHSEAVLALYGAGLDPFVGFYHELDFGRESLACDVIEPLRVQVERFACRLFNKGTLRAADFSKTAQGCLMGKAARERFYPAWDALAEMLRRELADSVENIAEALVTRVEGSPCPG